MAGVILTDCKMYIGGYNVSGHHNSMNLEYGAEMLDDTVFGTGAGGTRSNKPGLKMFNFSGDGFWDTVMDPVFFNRIGAVREVMSFAAEGTAEGHRAFTVRGVNGTYNPMSGAVGELIGFNITAQAANTPLVRGVVLALGSKGATGNSAAGQNLGLLGSGQRAYSALHVTAVNPTDISVIVQSDDNSGFSSPTTRLVHPLVTSGGGVTASWVELAGPIATDTWWRSQWTLTGVGPFTIFHVFGIQ